LLSPLFDPLVLLSWRRVPPSMCLVSFVRLLLIRQPDKHHGIYPIPLLVPPKTVLDATRRLRAIRHLISDQQPSPYRHQGWAIIKGNIVAKVQDLISRSVYVTFEPQFFLFSSLKKNSVLMTNQPSWPK
jgi:hypothetical protein